MSGTTMFGGETGVTGGLSSGRSPQSFTSIMSDTPSDASNNPVMPIDGHQVKQIFIQSLTNRFLIIEWGGCCGTWGHLGSGPRCGF